MEKLKFIIPSTEMRPAAMDFRQAFEDAGEKEIPGSLNLNAYGDFSEWLESLTNDKSTTYFVFRQPGNLIAGAVNIKHKISDGGHITCSVRPSERGKGYGTKIMRLALDRARELGVVEAEVECPRSNPAARKIIRRNGLERDEGSPSVYRKAL